MNQSSACHWFCESKAVMCFLSLESGGKTVHFEACLNDHCYGLNVCVPSETICWNSSPQGHGPGRWGHGGWVGHGDEAPMTVKETPRPCLFSSSMWGQRSRLWVRKLSLSRHCVYCTLIWDVPASRTSLRPLRQWRFIPAAPRGLREPPIKFLHTAAKMLLKRMMRRVLACLKHPLTLRKSSHPFLWSPEPLIWPSPFQTPRPPLSGSVPRPGTPDRSPSRSAAQAHACLGWLCSSILVHIWCLLLIYFSRPPGGLLGPRQQNQAWISMATLPATA